MNFQYVKQGDIIVNKIKINFDLNSFIYPSSKFSDFLFSHICDCFLREESSVQIILWKN